MNNPSTVQEFLADRVSQGLDPQAERELEGLLLQEPDLDTESFELAAAAIDLACNPAEEPLPAPLLQNLTQQARDFYRPEESMPEAEHWESQPSKVLAFPSSTNENTANYKNNTTANENAAPDRSPWLGWVAAAASLLLAIAGWWPQATPTPQPEAERARLVAQATDLLQLEWSQTEDPAAIEARGDVVWSNELQQGYMRFRGLPVNDPTNEQYQLWIFDAEQNEAYPVDGGVFDIPTAGEVVVPISAKLKITRPTLFAITIEKPGGVVVSSRERLPLLAQVG